MQHPKKKVGKSETDTFQIQSSSRAPSTFAAKVEKKRVRLTALCSRVSATSCLSGVFPKVTVEQP